MTREIELSAILCTHNPHGPRLERTLDGLSKQTLEASRWELIVVDNGNVPELKRVLRLPEKLAAARFVREQLLGLTPARIAGIRAASGSVLVFVDDDNVLAPDYLGRALALMADEPLVGAGGGIVEGEFELPVPSYARPYLGLLGIRDFGSRPMRALVYDTVGPWEPIGAGMVLRSEVGRRYLDRAADPFRRTLDRKGDSLGSCGDTDMARCAPELGYYLAYEPTLRLRHLIPAFRLTWGYLFRLCYGIARSGTLLDRIRTGDPQPLRGHWEKWVRLVLDVLRTAGRSPRVWALAMASKLGEYDARLVRLKDGG